VFVAWLGWKQTAVVESEKARTKSKSACQHNAVSNFKSDRSSDDLDPGPTTVHQQQPLLRSLYSWGLAGRDLCPQLQLQKTLKKEELKGRKGLDVV